MSAHSQPCTVRWSEVIEKGSNIIMKLLVLAIFICLALVDIHARSTHNQKHNNKREALFKNLEGELDRIAKTTGQVKDALLKKHHKTNSRRSVADVNYKDYGLKTDIKESKNRKRNSARSNLWNPKPGKKLTIPYSFKNGFRFQAEVKAAIQAMNTHLQCDHDAWVPYSSESHDHRVEFIEDGGCYSYLGKDNYDGNKQPISIAEGCHYKHIILHEMMHAMGFHHEQNRWDRDNYITVNYNNIEEGWKSQFDKVKEGNIFETNVKYDYLSVMHYGLYAASKYGEKTMTLKDTPQARALSALQKELIGNTPDLSTNDLKELREYFRCDGSSTGTPSPPTPTETPTPTSSTSENPEVTTENPKVTTENPEVTTENPEVTTENPEVTTENPGETTETPITIDECYIELMDCVRNVRRQCVSKMRNSKIHKERFKNNCYITLEFCGYRFVECGKVVRDIQ